MDLVRVFEKFKYFSDSNGKWGNNNLSVALKTIKEYENIYLLTHPVWWSNTKKPKEKINDCIKVGFLMRLRCMIKI